MNILGLKGYSNLGHIDHYFTEGCFPQKFNWTVKDTLFIVDTYNSYLDNNGITTEDYILICFSDGGVPGHPIAAMDPRCKGIIAHSASFPENEVISCLVLDARYALRTKRPVLLLDTYRDLTSWFPSRYGRSQQALTHYLDLAYPVEYHTLPRTTWHGHEFANGLSIMKDWCRRHFSFELPICC